MPVALRPLSLGRRIVASVALGLGLILFLFGLVSVWTIRESTETAYGERVAFAQALATRVDDVLRYSEQTLQSQADELGLEPGQPLSDAQRRQLADLRLRFGSFVVLSVSDVDGANTWTEPPSALAEVGNPLGHPSAQAVARTGRPQIAELTSPPDRSRVLACLAVPVRDTNGQLVAVLMAELDPSHPSLGILPSDSSSSSVRAQFLSGNSSADSPYTAEHRVLLADLIRARAAGYRIHEASPGARFPSHVVAYAPVAGLPSWGITLEEPQDVALAMPRRLELRLALSGLLALLLAAAVAWLDVRRVVGPLKRLTAAAERFAAGHLDEPVPLDRPLDRSDELGVLGRAFEMMRQQLRASLAEVAEWNRSALLEPDRVIALVVLKARDLFGSDVAGLALVGERDSTLTWQMADGAGANRRIQQPPGDGPFAPVMESALPVVISRDDSAGEAPICWPPVPCLRSALAVPLQSQGRVFGVLMVGSQSPRAFGRDQLALLSRLAAQAAVALENARLYRQTQSEAALEERERIAREMHDGLGQVLGYVNTKTLAVARLLDVGKVEEARVQVAQLEAVAKEVYADVREAILGLRTTLGPEQDFLAALREYLEGYERQSGIAVRLEVMPPEGRLALPFAAEIQLLRIVQEALTNVRKHAQARQALVRLMPASGELRLAVEDDGRGFDPARQTPEGWPRFGLQTMQERAKAIGGRLRVESRIDGGTRVVVWVPQEHQEGSYESASSLARR